MPQTQTSYPFIFANKYCRPFFQNVKVFLIIDQKFTPSSCKDIGIRTYWSLWQRLSSFIYDAG